MEAFPAFFPLTGAVVVVAGEGEAADAKARLFQGSPARVLRLTGAEARDPEAYVGATLVFLAGQDAAEADILAAARAAGAPLNVVDRPDLSDFHTPAIIDRGQVVAAVGTAGAAPVLASLLRAEIETRLPPALGDLARLLGARRAAILAAYPDFATRRAFYRQALTGSALDAATRGDVALAGVRLDDAIATGTALSGRVSLIEAPRETDLIPLRAVRALAAADALFADVAAEAIVSAHARRDVTRLETKAPEGLAAIALRGERVVVLEARPDAGLARDLEALGVAVEVIAAAPCP